MRHKISIIIAARNNGKYLREAIESSLNQTVKCEVVYADDGSCDNSMEIANEYRVRGLILAPGPNLGACEARNRGVVKSSGEYLIHLDGDDKLTPNFAEKHLLAMYSADDNCPFVYGPAQAFGAHNTLWTVPDWKDYDMWKQNTVNTSSMYTREAFLGCGGWQDPPHSMWDFDLAVRASRFGTPQKSDAMLLYRQHTDSWSHQTLETIDTHRQYIAREVRLKNARISIGTVYGGRLVEMLPQWLSQLATAARMLRSPQPVQLVILDNSGVHDVPLVFEHELKRYPVFQDVKIESFPEKPMPWSDEKQRRNNVATFLAKAYNKLQELMTGDIRWLVEDDIFVPISGGREMLEHLTLGAGVLHIPNAVAGCYRNRHNPANYVGGHFLPGALIHRELTNISQHKDPFPVDYTGTGCLMYWASRCPKVWKSHYKEVPAHDWQWSFELKQMSGKLEMLPSVKCVHAISPDKMIRA